MIHEINSASFAGLLPGFSTNPAVPLLISDCAGSMMCDMHYELDWSYRLRTEVNCVEALETDPCFATTACMCDTGYFKVADTMPEKPKDLVYDGFKAVFKEFERIEATKNNVEVVTTVDEEDDEGMGILLYIIIGGSVCLIIFVVVLACVCTKRCKKARGTPTQQAMVETVKMNGVNKYGIDSAIVGVSDPMDQLSEQNGTCAPIADASIVAPKRRKSRKKKKKANDEP